MQVFPDVLEERLLAPDLRTDVVEG